MKKILISLFFLLNFFDININATPVNTMSSATASSGVEIVKMPRKQRTVARNKYEDTLFKISDTVCDFFKWQDIDLGKARKNAVWSSVGLFAAILCLLLFFLLNKKLFLVKDNFLLSKEQIAKLEQRTSKNLVRFLSVSVIVLSAALVFQNIMAVRYLASAREFDFMVIGHTPFWEFLGAFIAVAIVIALIFFYNVCLTGVAAMIVFTGKKDKPLFSVYGLILPCIAYILMMLASVLNIFNINILPFAFKVLRFGCILLPVITIIFSIINKKALWFAIPYGIICGFSLYCLGIILAFYLPTIAILTLVITLIPLVLAFFIGSPGFGMSLGSNGGAIHNLFSPSDMTNIYKKDKDGNEVFKSETNDKLYKNTIAGYQEVDKEDIIE